MDAPTDTEDQARAYRSSIIATLRQPQFDDAMAARGATSNYAIAKLLGVTPQVVMRLRSGEAHPGIVIVAAACGLLDIPFKSIFAATPPREAEAERIKRRGRLRSVAATPKSMAA